MKTAHKCTLNIKSAVKKITTKGQHWYSTIMKWQHL